MSKGLLAMAAALAPLAVSPGWAVDEQSDETATVAGPARNENQPEPAGARVARIIDADGEVARPRLAVRCVLEIVLRRLRVAARTDVEPPEVLFESTTPLRQFQDAVAPQWGFRPHAFTNAYVPARNEIYLTDSASAYGGADRTIDDSLAHELTHHVQAKYLGMMDEPSIETQAVAVQTWFRDQHARGALSSESCESQGSP